jgi:hypothetical protein
VGNVQVDPFEQMEVVFEGSGLKDLQYGWLIVIVGFVWE